MVAAQILVVLTEQRRLEDNDNAYDNKNKLALVFYWSCIMSVGILLEFFSFVERN